MDDDFDELDAGLFLTAMADLNPMQRLIIDGVMATLQAIDDEEVAARWLKRNRRQILAELHRAGPDDRTRRGSV